MKNKQVEKLQKIVIDFEFEGDVLKELGKTMRDWFSITLGYTEYAQAIANVQSQGNERYLDELYARPNEALDKAFTWEESEQGHAYWSNIHSRLEQYEHNDDEEDEAEDEDNWDYSDEDDDN